MHAWCNMGLSACRVPGQNKSQALLLVIVERSTEFKRKTKACLCVLGELASMYICLRTCSTGRDNEVQESTQYMHT